MFTSQVKKVYFDDYEIANFKEGDKVQFDSGMGGTFSAVIKEITKTHFMVKVTNQDHEHQRMILKSDAHNIFYILERA